MKPIVVCGLAADGEPRVPGCTLRHCADCRRPVWMAPSSVLSAPGSDAMCLACFVRVPDDEVTLLPLTDHQMRELQALKPRR